MPTLPAIFDVPPTLGPIPSPRPAVYAELACEVARPPEYQTGGLRWDFRKVAITLRGPYEQVKDAQRNVLAVFNQRTKLVFPSGAPFLRWRPLDAGTIRRDQKAKRGDQVFMAVVTAEVWSERSD